MNKKIGLLLLLWPIFGYAHDLEDGFVERAVEVVIWDQTLQIKYFVGLNPATMDQLLERWEKDESRAAQQSDLDADSTESRFKKSFQRWLAEGLKLTVDGQSTALKIVGTEECPKHHFDFSVSLACDLERGKTVKISIDDSHLGHWDSAARYALKGRGSTIVSNSNVAPILVRSKRVEFLDMPHQQRMANSKIVATVITPPDR